MVSPREGDEPFVPCRRRARGLVRALGQVQRDLCVVKCQPGWNSSREVFSLGREASGFRNVL